MRFTDADVGRKVVYWARHDSPNVFEPVTYGPPEEGVITSVTNKYVFVRYGSDVGSKATPPDCLILVGRVDREQ